VGPAPLPLGIARFVFILRENELPGEYPKRRVHTFAQNHGRQGGEGTGDSHVRFHVSDQRSGNLTSSAWPSTKLTLTPQALGSGWLPGQLRGALFGDFEPCRAMVTQPMEKVKLLPMTGPPRNKSLGAPSFGCGWTTSQIASTNTGVVTGYRAEFGFSEYNQRLNA
jgi:hypothetical protein